MPLIDERPRARENCAFYPACYVAGDCEHNGWKSGNCGLSDEDKAAERTRFQQSLAQTVRRQRLIERARRGEFDHLDEQPTESLQNIDGTSSP